MILRGCLRYKVLQTESEHEKTRRGSRLAATQVVWVCVGSGSLEHQSVFERCAALKLWGRRRGVTILLNVWALWIPMGNAAVMKQIDSMFPVEIFGLEG